MDVYDLKRDVLMKKKLLQTSCSRLPDGGAKLKKHIEKLELEIEKLSIKEVDQNNSSGNVLPGDNAGSPLTVQCDSQGEENCKPSSVKTYGTKGQNPQAKENGETDNSEREQPIFSVGNRISSKGKENRNDVTGNSVSVPSDYISFSELSAKYHAEGKNSYVLSKASFPQSPSFTSYRTKPKPSMKFTEAKPICPELLVKKPVGQSSSHSVGTHFHTSTQLISEKELAVLNIHNSLKTFPSEAEEEVDPKALKTALMKHQKQALSWLLWRETQEPCGGIFADDMGLGKTLTMIALILKNSEQQRKCGPTIVICLAAVIHQWKSEITRHCEDGALNVLLYHGANRASNVEEIKQYDIVLTTYHLVLSEGKNLHTKNKESPLFKIKWQRIILDEAHTIKNYKSQTAKFIFELNSSAKWAVTGTPIHNDLKDLYSLLKYLKCKPFDDYKVWKKLVNDFSETSVKRRSALMKSLFLRRSKNDIDDLGNPLVRLPQKWIKIHKINLSDTEMKIYNEVYKMFKEKIEERLVSKVAKSKTVTKHSESSIFLTSLLKLQQCCNHPSLMGVSAIEGDTLSNSMSSNDSISDILSDFSGLSIDGCATLSGTDTSVLQLESSFNVDEFNFPKSQPSTKISKLIKKLTKIIQIKEKVVVVSQWVSMLDVVALHLEKASIKYHVIKGATKAENRNFIADDFNTNPEGHQVLLMSLKAGGTGLNLVGANHLFILDRHWNPALETQACDRIYRVGQTRDVFIHKFICEGTIEEKIVELQKEKEHIAHNVLADSKRVSHFSIDYLKQLFID